MKKYISIGNKKIGEGQPVFIIAEAGTNHNGSLKLAKKMVVAARAAGADAVKFQTFKTERFVTKAAPKADYQKNAFYRCSQFDMLKRLELSKADFKNLFACCEENNTIFISAPFDHESAEFLFKLGVAAFKVGSGELTDIPLLSQIAHYRKPMILSTGMANLNEVKEAVSSIRSAGNEELILLHCTSSYPAACKDVNLKAIDTLKKNFNIVVGYSDHTEGIHISTAAVARGACVIEKHFTLKKGFVGPDHKFSLEPGELKDLVMSIREVEDAIGSGVKTPAKSEFEIRDVARKSIVARRDIKKGQRISFDMLSVKRPGTGIGPKYMDRIAGKTAKVAIKKDTVLKWNLLR